MNEQPTPGVAERLSRLADTALDTAQTRLALLAVEVEEEGIRLGAALFNLILAALFLGFGVIAIAIFLTVWWWDEHRLLALGLDVLLFLGLAGWAGSNARRRLEGGTRLFRDSIAEIAADRASLRARRE